MHIPFPHAFLIKGKIDRSLNFKLPVQIKDTVPENDELIQVQHSTLHKADVFSCKLLHMVAYWVEAGRDI